MATPQLIPSIMPYLTIIPGRQPNQKLHKAIGHAKNAFSQASYYKGRWGELYEWKDGEWVLLYTIPEPQVVHTEVTERGYTRVRFGETRPWKLGG